MKKCSKCGAEKPLDDFYNKNAQCKECIKKRVRENRKKKIEYYREYDRKRGKLPHRVKAVKEYAKTDAGKKSRAKAQKKYRGKYPNKYNAHVIVNNAIRDKKLFAEPCEVCGEKAHAHHDDYAKPLNVRWLCAEHHREWHEINGEGLNAK